MQLRNWIELFLWNVQVKRVTKVINLYVLARRFFKLRCFEIFNKTERRECDWFVSKLMNYFMRRTLMRNVQRKLLNIED